MLKPLVVVTLIVAPGIKLRDTDSFALTVSSACQNGVLYVTPAPEVQVVDKLPNA